MQEFVLHLLIFLQNQHFYPHLRRALEFRIHLASCFQASVSGGVYPATGPDHQISLTQITKKKKEQVLSATYQCVTTVWTAVFTLHSRHIENVSRARYIVGHQSHIFYRAHNGARKMYVLSKTTAAN